MAIFHERVDSGFGVAGADRENGEFAGERDKTFENEGDRGQLGLGLGDLLRRTKNPLTLAIVAHPRSLQNGGKSDRFYGAVELAGIRNGGKFGGGDAEFAEE